MAFARNNADMDNEPDLEHLAQALRDRAEQLGLSQSALVEETKRLDPRGKGLSIRTVNGLFNAADGGPTERTRGLLEAALHWPSGAVRSIMDGGAPPEPLDRDTAVRVAELADEVAELRGLLRQVAQALGDAVNGTSDVGDI